MFTVPAPSDQIQLYRQTCLLPPSLLGNLDFLDYLVLLDYLDQLDYLVPLDSLEHSLTKIPLEPKPPIICYTFL